MEATTPSGTQKISALVIALLMLGLATVCTLSSLRWIGTPFPGFFLLENRVIASVTLPHWPISEPHPNLLQSEVVAVNGTPLVSAESLYTLVRSLPPGTFVEYTVRKQGRSLRLKLPTFVFTWRDYTLIFGAYLFTALTIVVIGIGVWFLTPATPASRALLIAGVVTGVFGITGLDLYAPFHFFRLHVLAEAFLPAGYIHLALVFPVDRFRRLRTPLIVLPYLVSSLLAVVYEVFLYQPSSYSLIHNLCMVQVGVAMPLFLGRFLWDYFTTSSPLVWQRIRIMLIGFVGGYCFPATLMFFSGIMRGEVAVNAMAFTAFFFPLSIGYAIVKHDLFEIDAFLKRWSFYLTLTAVLTVLHVSGLALFHFLLRSWDFAHAPSFSFLFAIGLVFFWQPLKDTVQRGVDRVFFRVRYDPKQVLNATSASLAATLQLHTILPLLWHTIQETVGVRQGGIFLLLPGQPHYVLAYPTRVPQQTIASSHSLLAHLRRQRRVLSLLDGPPNAHALEVQDPLPAMLAVCQTQLLVPLFFESTLLGVLALGPKNTSEFFSADDIDFLSTLANQGALAIANALAYQEIQDLNHDLEKQVSQVREKEQEVVRSQTQLRHLSAHLLHLQEEERERISRELHDHLGQLLAAMAMDLKWVKTHCAEDSSAMRERLQEMSHLVQLAARTTRELSVSLRPEILSKQGLEVALKQYATEFERRSGLLVHFSSDLAELDLPLQMTMNIYRIVQEALSNVARHAEARTVTITAHCANQVLTASVVDDGSGFENERFSDPHALGLVGMQERARLIGGSVEITSMLGAGVKVVLTVPIPTATVPVTIGQENYDYDPYR